MRRRLSGHVATTAAASSSTSSERAAIARAKSLFGAEHANVQPHSGAQANMSVYFTLLKPGDTVLGMNLAHGGHLTHGHPLNFSGKLYTIVPYGVSKDDERIDYDELDRLADEHKPKMIMVGASAYPRIIDFARIRRAADRVGAPIVTDMAHIAGLVAGGVHPSPVPHSDFVTTTTHKTLRGPRAGMVLCRERYAKELDKSAVFRVCRADRSSTSSPGKAACLQGSGRARLRRVSETDRGEREEARERAHGERLPPGQRRHRQSPDARRRVLEGHHRQGGGSGPRQGRASPSTRTRFPSIRIRRWSPAASASARRRVTTRGMRETEMETIGELITRALATPDDDRALGMVRTEVEALCRKFPLYPE